MAALTGPCLGALYGTSGAPLALLRIALSSTETTVEGSSRGVLAARDVRPFLPLPCSDEDAVQGLEACCSALDLVGVYEETLMVSSRARAGALHALAAWIQSISTVTSSSSSSLPIPATTSTTLVVLLPVVLAACGDVTKIVRQGATMVAKALSEMSPSRGTLTLGKGLEKSRHTDGNHNAGLEALSMTDIVSFGQVVSNANHAIVDDRWVASMTIGNTVFRSNAAAGSIGQGRGDVSVFGTALRRLAVLFGWSAPHITVAVVEASASNASLSVSWTQLLRPLLLQSTSYHLGSGTTESHEVEMGPLSADAEQLVGALVRGLSTIQLADKDVQKEVVTWVCQCVTGTLPSSSPSSSSSSSSSSLQSRLATRGHKHHTNSSHEGQDNALTEALCDEVLRLLAQDWTANLGKSFPLPVNHTIFHCNTMYSSISDIYFDVIITLPFRYCHASASI